MAHKKLLLFGCHNVFGEIMSSVIIIKDNFDDLAKGLSFINAVNKKLCIVTDDNVSTLYLKKVKDSLSALGNQIFSFVIKPGEDSKNLDTVKSIYDFLLDNKFDRDDFVLALGGGVVGDISGFTASTYKRGLRFVQIPTTLLAQVDSSVGGKNGVDYRMVKNAVGTFCQPSLIYINKETVSTLPEEELSNGKAEQIKTGIISGKGYEPSIDECISFKKLITDEDPYDEYKRQILNFGHTIGHSIESAYGYKYKHGICVGLGMICAEYISVKRGWLDEDKLHELKKELKDNGLKTSVDGIDIETVLNNCCNDKKVRDGIVRFVLLKGIGNPVIVDDVSRTEILDALEAINEKG